MFKRERLRHFIERLRVREDVSLDASFALEFLRWIPRSLALGVLLGTVSAAFLLTLDWITSLREHHRWIIGFLPLVGFLIGWMYDRFGQEVAAGNQLVARAIEEPNTRVPFRLAPFVYVASLLTHLFGGSAGREGTAIQLAAAFATPFQRMFLRSDQDRRILTTAAVAGGFGSVFGTPLAGFVFALEFSRGGGIRYRAALPALMTAFVADAVTDLWQVTHTVYDVSTIPNFSVSTMAYAVLAVLCFGCTAVLFRGAMQAMTSLFERLIAYAPFRPVVGGLLVVLGVYLLGSTKYIGLGIPTIEQAFVDSLPTYDFFLKLVFTVVTLAAGFKGGEVTPLFFIGATLGNALHTWIPLPIGALAGMGFVAVFAGVTKTPIACSLMALELFGGEIGIFTTVACVGAYFVSVFFQKVSR